MAGKIFINYRRGDDAGFTQALYQRLEDEFTAADLFMDVEGHIKPGDDFVEVLNNQVAQCDVLLVIIGPRWAELLAARAGAKDDFVTIEIAAALDRQKRVIPVLVGGSGMPRTEMLPAAIEALARRNAVGLRPERFRADCQGLITALKEQLAAAELEKAARTDAERKAAEAERQKREAEEAARLAAAEERARAQRVAGLSPEEVRKAEELANWEFIKERGDPQALRDHLARFPGGVTTLYAMTRLEVLVWAGLDASADGLRLQAFLDEFPKGANSDKARVRLAELGTEEAKAKSEAERRAKETDAWGAVAAGTDVATIEAFLKAWPKGQHVAAAKTRIAELKRGSGARGRWMLQGAAVTAGAVALAAAGWWGVEQWRWRATPLDHVAQAGESFSECGHCPVMVVLPAGAVAMGSTDGASDEKPPHQVTIAKAVAVGKYTVTFDEWDACVTAGACDHYHPNNQSWGRGTRPVINVSWDNAKSYVAWLSAKTGRGYRLLSEAEWEYAARAGATTKYYWGDDIGKGNANCSGCGSQWDGKQTAPVGSFQPNAFGLYDMLGNVWQWCEDTRQVDYQGAPNDGSAWVVASSSSRVLRGGSWLIFPQFLRSAVRYSGRPDYRGTYVGFRVARTL